MSTGLQFVITVSVFFFQFFSFASMLDDLDQTVSGLLDASSHG